MRPYFLQIIILLLAISLGPATAEAQEVRYSRSGDDLQSIAERFFPEVKIKYAEQIEDYKRDLQKWNPHVQSWNDLQVNTPLYTDYPYMHFLSFDYAAQLKMNSAPPADLQFKNNFFYTASLGTFSEQTAQNQSIKSTQNSPVSLGLGSAYKMSDKQYIVGSVYWSKLIASTIEGGVANANSKISVPSEIGLNLYYQHPIASSQWSVYAGLDHERFATFNTADLELGSSLEARTNDLTYATLGIIKNFIFKANTLTAKVSWAQSIISKNSTGLTGNDFEGARALVFLSMKTSTAFTYHFLFKRHTLNGPTKLTINRAGIGAGYAF